MKLKPVRIDGNQLTVEQVLSVARRGATVRLAPVAARRMNASRSWVEQAVRDHAIVYGVTTGFGAFQNVWIRVERLRELQRNLILSHCAGVGDPFGEDVVRAMLLLRANALAKGLSGIRVSTVERLLAMLNRGVHPVVPEQGSVGASGDLSPLSHIAAVLIGEGEAFYRGKRMPGRRAMRAAKVSPVVLEAKEGLALNNGTQAMTALGALGVHDAGIVADAADVAAGLSLEAVKGKSTPFDRRVVATRSHPGQSTVARNIRAMVRGSRLVDRVDHDTREKVQDAYSIRCAPQVHGASRDAIAYVREVIEREINAATDNPLIFADTGEVFSVGNFHGQPVALAMDFLGLAVAELGNVSERRTAKLVDKNHSCGLPPFLAGQGGIESGMMIAQYTAAALVSENKILTHPASSDSIPTSANQEDHVSMGTIGARHARDILRNVERVIGIELLCAAEALEYRSERPGEGTRHALELVRSYVAPLRGDRELTTSIEACAALVRSGKLSELLSSFGDTP
jgi:histidine ammonia-lyase